MKKSVFLFAVSAVLCLIIGFLLAFFFAWRVSVSAMIFSLIGIFVSFALAPIFHECGHIILGKTQNMRLVYTKFFCFKIAQTNGKLRFSFASPFIAEQTQMIPAVRGNMKKRAEKYTAGGLIFGGGIFLLFAVVAIVLSVCKQPFAFFFYGFLPYTGYLFMLNAVPVYFAGGKTDALIIKGIRKGLEEEKVMLSAMEIFGGLSEGKSFSEMEEELYFDLPAIAESLPMYQTITDLRYRYRLEIGDFDGAAKEINRLAQLTEYMEKSELLEVAAELAYMHALGGDLQRAKQARKLCEEFLSQETLAAKRINAAFFKLIGEIEKAEEEKTAFEKLLSTERILGKRKAESILINR